MLLSFIFAVLLLLTYLQFTFDVLPVIRGRKFSILGHVIWDTSTYGSLWSSYGGRIRPASLYQMWSRYVNLF